MLLILTDGVIMDMQQTVDAIVHASHSPLSIVIVGVGKADFTAMNALDSDDKILSSSSGQIATRDIVQFVPFAPYSHQPARLAAEVLREIPGQIVGYMRSKQIQPHMLEKVKPPVQRATAPPSTTAQTPPPSTTVRTPPPAPRFNSQV